MKLLLITPQILAERAAERFCDTHHHGLQDRAAWKPRFTKGQIYEQLLAVSQPTPEKIAVIIGNDSWTNVTCSACNENVSAAVAIDVTGGEYATHICEKCANALFAAFRAYRGPVV